MNKIDNLIVFTAMLLACVSVAIQGHAKTNEKNARPEITKQFIGIWAENKGNCKSVKNGQSPGIFIESKMIDLGPEGSCDIRLVTKSVDNYLSGNFLCNSEGSTSKANYSFELKNTEEMIIFGWGDKPRNFNKCNK